MEYIAVVLTMPVASSRQTGRRQTGPRQTGRRHVEGQKLFC